MGPNAAAKEFIKPDILDGPRGEPGPGGRRRAARSSCSDLERRRASTSDASRWTTLAGDAGCRCEPPGRAARCVLPGHRLAGAVLPRPARRSSWSSASGRRTASGAVLFDHLTLENYAARSRPTFLPTVWNSFRYAALTTILSILIGYPIAYWIRRYGGRNKTLLLILVMLPFWTSYLIRTYAWMIILRDNGVVNSVLQARRA